MLFMSLEYDQKGKEYLPARMAGDTLYPSSYRARATSMKISSV